MYFSNEEILHVVTKIFSSLQVYTVAAYLVRLEDEQSVALCYTQNQLTSLHC